MTIKYLHAALLSSSLIAMGLVSTGFSQQASADERLTQNTGQHAQPSVNTPTELVQAFLNTMEYQYLSNEDKAVWDERTWNQIQQRAVHANQPRLPQHHEFFALESFVREFVQIEAIDYERADDGTVRVNTKTAYPNLLILMDDYADTKSSGAYEQLTIYQAQFTSGELNAETISIHTSEMPWRVNASGVYVNAAKMQLNKEHRQAQSGW